MNNNLIEDSNELDKEAMISNKYCITRSRRVSKLCDFKKSFLETAHMQIDNSKRR